MSERRICIIGAGHSEMSALWHCVGLGVADDVVCFEKQETWGKWSKGAGGKLKDYIKFNTAVRYVKYENETKTSIVTVEDVAKKETREETFTHVIVASGIYSFPNTPTFPGIESFGGRVIHSHDLRSARHFHGQRVLVIGAAYSGEDIPTQLIKFGAQNVTLAFRRQPKRYRNHFPFLESRFRIDDETHPYPAGLYNGTLFHKEGNNNLFIRGDFKQEPVSREEMQKSADEWHQLANECKNEHDIVRFQARVIKHLVEAADYPYPEICQMEPLLLE
ncbi:FMO6-like protein [Mya arenaria]|uniref:Flavin-containing monooxygenase n=1 Tax=Mya arenaria TaxID=6604 RepID=A0ABY7EHF6_MYAAR|nr:FMO6-like protein [Mya arenaria]